MNIGILERGEGKRERREEGGGERDSEERGER